MVGLTDRPDMTLDVYRGRKTTIQQHTFFSAYLYQCRGRAIALPMASVLLAALVLAAA